MIDIFPSFSKYGTCLLIDIDRCIRQAWFLLAKIEDGI